MTVNNDFVKPFKISVIVPVYNAERYLKRCVQSVISQTYSNWELILIDDGSVDNSTMMIDDYALTDERIIGIHQKNAGAGMARNRGLQTAVGEYVVFLDSDDYLDKDYFAYLLPKARGNDIVFIDAVQVDGEGNSICSETMSIHRSKSKDELIRGQMTGNIPWGGWRKAVSLQLVRNHKIQYSCHKIGEEALYSFQLLRVASKFTFLDEKPVYYYVNRENSLSRSKDLDPWGGGNNGRLPQRE